MSSMFWFIHIYNVLSVQQCQCIISVLLYIDIKGKIARKLALASHGHHYCQFGYGIYSLNSRFFFETGAMPTPTKLRNPTNCG